MRRFVTGGVAIKVGTPVRSRGRRDEVTPTLVGPGSRSDVSSGSDRSVGVDKGVQWAGFLLR